jgi:hypothetical protein
MGLACTGPAILMLRPFACLAALAALALIQPAALAQPSAPGTGSTSTCKASPALRDPALGSGRAAIYYSRTGCEVTWKIVVPPEGAAQVVPATATTGTAVPPGLATNFFVHLQEVTELPAPEPLAAATPFLVVQYGERLTPNLGNYRQGATGREEVYGSLFNEALAVARFLCVVPSPTHGCQARTP